jgi:hypothetical protein
MLVTISGKNSSTTPNPYPTPKIERNHTSNSTISAGAVPDYGMGSNGFVDLQRSLVGVWGSGA